MDEHLVNLTGHLSWPLTAIFLCVILRKELKKLFSALARKIGDPRSRLSIIKNGLEVESVYKAQIESLELEKEQFKELALDTIDSTQESHANESDEIHPAFEELTTLADEYLAIDIPNWADRVRAKDASARKMAKIVISNDISRQYLAGKHHEGLIIALATTIHTLPKNDDPKHILRIADEANRLHVKYRIVLAMGKLLEKGIPNRYETEEFTRVLESYLHDADQPLERRISYTMTLL